MFNYLIRFNRDNIRKKNIIHNFSLNKEILSVESFSQDTIVTLGEFSLIKGKVHQNRQAIVFDKEASFLGFAPRSEEDNGKLN